MGLIRIAIRRPMTTLMTFVVLLIMGYQAYTLIQIDNFPDVDFPAVTVLVAFPNASPEDVEDLIIEPIEEAVAGISGIDSLNSEATEGMGTIAIAFKDGIDGDEAAIEVERNVSAIRNQLPEEAEEPSIIKIERNAIPIIEIVLTGPQSQDDLFEFADEVLKERFQAIAGVASVSVAGGREREIQVNINPAKLTAYSLTLNDVERAVRDSNDTFPVGSIELGRQESTIRSVSEFENFDEIENVVIQTNAPNSEAVAGQIYVRNIATVEEGFEDKDQIIRYNGVDAVNISITKTSDGNTVDVADAVYRVLDEIEADLPAGAEVILVTDDSEIIRASVNGVQQDLILAILITGVIMLAFLHRVQTTLIVLLAIPLSLIGTLIVMWALGFTLNQITLMAMTLIIGNLVDDSIVVLENTERHIKMNKSPAIAAIDARREILLASLVIASTDLVVYLPVAFMSGIAGQVFFPYGVTIAGATLCSLFVGFTLTPMLASKWMKDPNEPEREPGGLLKLFSILLTPVTWLWTYFTKAWNTSFNFLANAYAGLLRLALANVFTQTLVILAGVGLLAGGGYLIVGGAVGIEFFPQEDDGQFRIEIEMPPGTTLETTDQIVRQVELIVLQEVPETVGLLSVVGSEGSGGMDTVSATAPHQATITGRLVDQLERDRSITEIIDTLRPLLQRLPEALISTSLNSSLGPGGQPISLELYGLDPDTMIELANEMEAVMATVPGVVDIVNTDAARAPETEIIVNRELAVDQGLFPADVSRTLRTALTGQDIGDFDTRKGTEIDVVVRLEEAARNDFEQILQLPLSYTNGQPIKLDRIASIDETLAPAVIKRTDRQRVMTIESGVEGRAAGDVNNDIEAALSQQIDFPVGYGFEFSGNSESQREIFGQFTQTVILAVVLIYVLMVALYQSWLQPLAIMVSLPVAVVGSFGGLWLTGNTLNLFSILGIILLIGIITKNAILLVDFANQAREEGLTRKAALIEAGRMRLRAIMMTSLTLVFALMPMLMATGAGAVNRRPLAAVVMGGAILSTLLTLILIPVVYNFFDAGGSFVSNLFRRILGLKLPNQAEPEAQPTPESEPTPEPDAKPEPKPKPGSKPTPPTPNPQTQPGSA